MRRRRETGSRRPLALIPRLRREWRGPMSLPLPRRRFTVTFQLTWVVQERAAANEVQRRRRATGQAPVRTGRSPSCFPGTRRRTRSTVPGVSCQICLEGVFPGWFGSMFSVMPTFDDLFGLGELACRGGRGQRIARRRELHRHADNKEHEAPASHASIRTVRASVVSSFSQPSESPLRPLVSARSASSTT